VLVATAGLPSPPSLPQSGQPITIVVEPPSVVVATVPPPANSCIIAISYDNTQMHPYGTLFRGQTACGSRVYLPQMSGQAVLKDSFGNLVAEGSAFGPMTGSGPDTSQGDYVSTGTGILSTGLSGAGPVPGLDYTITFTSSITLPLQYWGPPMDGCSVSGQTLNCVNSTTYEYLPGTKGGFQP
jgi:hypothetical protein